MVIPYHSTKYIKGTFGIARYYQHHLYHHHNNNIHTLWCWSSNLSKWYAKPDKFVRLINSLQKPYLVFHCIRLIWICVFGTALKLGYSILTGSLTLSLMVLPLITRNTQEALKTVQKLIIGALGIGATVVYDTNHTFTFCHARNYHWNHSFHRTGRICGLFTTGSGFLLPQLGKYGEGLLEKFSSRGTLTIQLYQYGKSEI